MNAHRVLHRADGRLRAGWRLAAFLLVLLLCGMLSFGLLVPALSAYLGLDAHSMDAGAWGSLFALLPAHAIAVRWIDGRGWDEVWLGRAALRARPLAVATLLGALGIGLPSLALLAVGWLHAAPASSGSGLAAAARLALMLAPAALYEELMVRGYLLRTLTDAWGWRWALLATSVLFGLLHLGNPGANAENVSNVILAGVFLGGIVVATRSLYAAWLAHFAWNWTMAALLHMSVSGLGVSVPDYRVVDAGPDWATGGAWGAEGGAGATVGMVVGLLLLVAWRRRTVDRDGAAAPAATTFDLIARPERREEPFA